MSTELRVKKKTTRRVLAGALILAGASSGIARAAESGSYVNLLQFDLASFRSQATAGTHEDDVERVANATRLLEVDGNRLFTSFANLSRPATLGDNLVTYGIDEEGSPTTAELFDSGSYLLGWIGKIDLESDWVFSFFYQRNHGGQMVEDLDDGALGGTSANDDFETESAGTSVEPTDLGTGGNAPGDGDPDADVTRRWDLDRRDDRSAMNLDFGVARELSADLAVGGRFLAERDALDRIAGGTTEETERRKIAPGGPLVEVSRSIVAYRGDGEAAYENREIGVSLNADYHPWSTRALSVRLDLIDSKLVNPGSGAAGGLDVAREAGSGVFEDPAGAGVNFWERTVATRAPRDTGLGGTTLTTERQTEVTTTGAYALTGEGAVGASAYEAVYSVDDERRAFGLAGLLELASGFGGGDSRSWFGFSRRPYDLDAREVRRGYERTREWWNVDGADFQTTTAVDSTETIERRGDVTISAIEFGTRWNREMNRNVSVGCGVTWTRQADRAKYARTSTRTTHEEFADGHPDANRLDGLSTVPGTYDEFRIVTTTTLAERYDRRMRTRTVRLPVGVQFRWGKGGRFGWNMGARHAVTARTLEETRVVPEENGRRVRVENYAAHPADDGTTTIDASLPSSRVTRTERSRGNSTAYFYGFEWHITDAAQLNVNGLFDSHADATDDAGRITDVDFYRNLAVSLIFAF